MREKFAVSDLAWFIETVVVAELELFVPAPVQPIKLYPTLGLATTVGVVP